MHADQFLLSINYGVYWACIESLCMHYDLIIHNVLYKLREIQSQDGLAKLMLIQILLHVYNKKDTLHHITQKYVLLHNNSFS